MKLFRSEKTSPTPVYYDGIEIKEEERYQIVDIDPCIAVITKPDVPEPEDLFAAAVTHPERYFEAKIEYCIADSLSLTGIEKLSVYDPKKRGEHMGRDLIVHVLKQLKDDQHIWVSASASPTPKDMNDPSGPCYGLNQKELEEYYKRFTYGKVHHHILLRKEMKKMNTIHGKPFRKYRHKKTEGA